MHAVVVVTRVVGAAVRLTSRVLLLAAKAIHGMGSGRPHTDESLLGLHQQPKDYRP